MTTMREIVISEGKRVIEALEAGAPLSLDGSGPSANDRTYYPFAAGYLKSALSRAIKELERDNDQ